MHNKHIPSFPRGKIGGHVSENVKENLKRMKNRNIKRHFRLADSLLKTNRPYSYRATTNSTANLR